MMTELKLRPRAVSSLKPTLDDAGLSDRRESSGLDQIGRALSDPIRRSILISLLDGTRCPSDLAETIGTSRSNLSNHLSCLRGCGLVSAKRSGRRLHYGLMSAQLTDALQMLLNVAATLSECDETNQIRVAE